MGRERVGGGKGEVFVRRQSVLCKFPNIDHKFTSQTKPDEAITYALPITALSVQCTLYILDAYAAIIIYVCICIYISDTLRILSCGKFTDHRWTSMATTPSQLDGKYFGKLLLATVFACLFPGFF